MTVPVPSQLVYASQGDGSTTQFEYPVRFEEAGELVVISRVDGVDTVLTLNTDYTVAGAGVPAGGTVTMLYVPGTDEQIVRYRDTASKQIVDLQDRTKNPAEAVEDQLDRFAMIGQETREQLGRTVRVAPGNAPLKDFPPVQAGLPVLGNGDEDGLVFGEESYNGLRGRVDAAEAKNDEQDERLTDVEPLAERAYKAPIGQNGKLIQPGSGKYAGYDADGNLIPLAPPDGGGNMNSALNLSDVEDAAAAGTNLGFGFTTSDIASLNIPAPLMTIQTAGYAEPGDGGGAKLKRMDSTPDPVMPWQKPSADGAYWEIADKVVVASVFGAFPGVAADQSVALHDLRDFCIQTGAKGIVPATADRGYRIDNTVVFAANDLCIEFVGGAYLAPVDENLLIAVQIGATSAPSRMNISNLAVDRGSYNGTTENTGILWLEANQSTFENIESRFSKYNHRGAPTEGGNQQNRYPNLQGIGGFINFYLRPSGAGFFNENDFEGGRGFCTSDTNTNFRVDPDRSTGALFVTTSSISGTFQVGETITGGTSGATADVTKIAADGSNTRLYYENLVGDFEAAETVTGGTSAATGTVTSIRTPEAGHNRISMSLEGQGASGIYDNGNTNSWLQCRSEGVWSSGFFHICGPDCQYPLIISSRYDYTLDVGSNPDLRPTILTYTEGLTVTTAFNDTRSAKIVRSGANTVAPASGGVPAMELRDEFSSTGYSQLIDAYHGRDGATSFLWRSIRASDGLVRSSMTTDGRLTVARQLKNEQSSWTFQPLVLGAYYLWIDSSGRLRIKSGAPTSETDGTVVGAQT